MPDEIKISELDDAAPLDGTEEFPVVQGGTTLKSTSGAVDTYVISQAVSVAGDPAGGTSNLVARDANGNSAFNNVIENILFINALGLTTNLTAASAQKIIYNNNSINSILRMPDATTLVVLTEYEVINETTATISVQTSVGGAICTLGVGEHIISRLLVNSTAGGSWEFEPLLNVVTGATNQVLLAKNAFGQNVWSSNTLTMAGNLNFANDFNTSGNFAVTQTYTGVTNVTFPTSGTLITSAQVPTNLTQGSVVFIGASNVYSQDNSNFFWDGTNHQLGVGTNSLTSTDLATLSTTKANNEVLKGTKTSVDGSSNQSSSLISATYNPTSGSAVSSGFKFAGTFIAPSAQTILNAIGVSLEPKFDSNVGTITNAIGIFYNGGTSATGTVTNSYGGYFTIPSAGTIKQAIYGDNLVIGQSNTTTNPPNRGALIEGNIINSALSAFQLVGTDTNKTLTSMGNGASGTLLKSNGASALPTYTTATYPSTVTANRILYANATNAVSDLATGNSGVLITDGSGVPSITTRTSVTDIGGYQKIQLKTTASNDPSVTFTTGLTSYSFFKVVFFNVVPTTNSVFLLMQVSTNGGSSYITTGYLGGVHTIQYNQTAISNTTNTTGLIVAGGFTTSAGDTASGEIFFTGPANSPTILNAKTSLVNGGTPFNIQATGFIAQAPNAIRFVFTSGNFAAGGTFILSAIA